ncbi:MAG TPA: class I SAM-dependent methyltransferase [Planctomycetaceae bacterium]|nr:class I SAM-dependent methyltransferase [Planctomycetaceae bacterium]
MTAPRSELYEDIYRRAFSFGRNWQKFLERLDEASIERARKSLVDFLELPSLEGRTFVDVGCGSGLFSLAAWQLGADRVVSIDVDPASVACAEYLREKYASSSERWEIRSGSALDREFLASLGQFDIVYSWGVLHHTGAMWQAIENVHALVRPGGMFELAIYNDCRGFPSSQLWRSIKRLYARGGPLVRGPMTAGYLSTFFAALLLRGRNPVRYVREYGQRSGRGMSFYRDVVDWLGGYPYEFATAAEVADFHVRRGFKTLKIIETQRIGCNQFLFRRGKDES